MIRTIKIDSSLGVTEGAEDSPSKYLTGPDGPQGNIDDIPTDCMLLDLSERLGSKGSTETQQKHVVLDAKSVARNCLYLTSTEIVEIAGNTVLKCKTVSFAYLQKLTPKKLLSKYLYTNGCQ